MKIFILRDSETVRYAAEELKKYLKMIDGTEAEISFDSGDIRLGLLDDFGLSTDGVDDAVIDDVIDINIDSLKGYIAGSNERSILMGVYNFLKSAGCMWVRPGINGEFIPKVDMSKHSFTYRKKADYGFRGECIEGAVSYEHLRDTVEWLPKVNMNFFMIEQIVPFNYMDRWYTHEYNTVRSDEKLTYEQAEKYVYMLEGEIKKRGLQLHSLGHGYFYEPYGIHYQTNKTEYNVSDEARSTMALLDGKRGLSHNSPFHTQLCYSNEKARRDHIMWLVDYMKKKPYIDFLHIWLGDGANNQCECAECSKKTVSDWYMILLRELDEEFTRQGIDTKIVFIMYNDTMWAPEYEKILNKDRFIVTVTVQARDHGKVFSPERYKGKLLPYQRNNIDYMNSVDKMLSYKDAWKCAYDGRAFLFEYRMYTDHIVDPGYMSVSKIMYEDCRVLSELGFDGIISDKTQRSYFPTGLPMALMGETLFDKSLDYEEYAKTYFEKAFGADGVLAREYLEKITEYFDPSSLRVVVDVTYEDTGTGSKRMIGGIKGKTEVIPRLEKIAPYTDKFLATVKKNLSITDKCQAFSWKLLYYHTEYCKRFADVLISVAENDTESAMKKYESMLEYLSPIEEEISLEFDMHIFARKMKQIINK